MSNPMFDRSIITSDHIALLQEVADGKTHWRKGIVFLNQRNLTEDDGLHAVKVTGEGHFAINGVIRGSLVRVTNSYHLDFMHGAVGMVEAIHTSMVDADGIDKYGFVEKRATPLTTVLVRFAEHTGQWCFRNSTDLIGFPNWKVSKNNNWS